MCSICAVQAFACDDCKNDSQSINPPVDGEVVGAAYLRPHHRSTDTPDNQPGGAVYRGDRGDVTHLYMPYTGDYWTWARAEMYSGNADGLSGWISMEFMRVYFE